MDFIASEHSNSPWLIKQKWSDVLFYHFKLNPQDLQKLIPFKLDLYENQAFVSIVPFKMSSVQIKGIPKLLTSWKSLLEVNLRTYVIVDGVPGIYFITLDATSFLSVLIARYFFHLPYRHCRCHQSRSNPQTYDHQTRDSHFSTMFRIGMEKQKNDLDIWLTERYSLFTKNKNKTYRGIVSHKAWPLNEVKIEEMTDNFSHLIDQKFNKSDILSPSYCESLEVSFQPFKRLS